MEKNKDNGCIKMLVSLIESHKKVKSWNVDNDNNTLVIKLEEELGVYDIDVFNHFLGDLNEEDVFETNAKFDHKKDYTTIFTKLKNK
jgi:hypothetical protein